MKKFLLPSIAVFILTLLTALIITREYTDYERTWYDKKFSQYARELAESVQFSGKKADSPEMAALHNYFMTLDPQEQRVPLERLKYAYQETERLEKVNSLKSSGNLLEWDIVSSNMGGRTRFITYDPNDPEGNKVWAGGVTGGLWYNDDITSPFSSWVPVDDFWPGLSISCLEFDPNDPQTIYVGTGEAFTAQKVYRESTGLGIGILKSTDGGQNWSLLPSTEDFAFITDIEVRNENGNSVIYAGVASGLYKGVNHQSQPSDGLYRSFNGGDSWMQVMPLIPGSDKPYAVADIEISGNNRIFVGTKRNLDEEGGGTVLYSETGLIGSWNVYDDYVDIIQSDPEYPIPGRVMLASAPSDPDIIYGLFDGGQLQASTGFILSRCYDIARSDDGGQTWTARQIPTGGYYFWATLGWHALTLAIDPNNPNHLYIGGLDTYQSFDGGYNWVQVSEWALMYYGGGDRYIHADIHDIDFKEGSSTELLVTSDGGVFYTDEANQEEPAFQEKNMSYGTLQFYTCDIYPVAGSVKYVGGLQDNGTLYHTGTPLTINNMIDGGDGAYCFIDEDDPEIMITSVYYNQYSIFLNEQWYNSASNWQSGIFINPADYDYDNKTLYANACSYSGQQVNKLLRISGIPDYPNGTYVNVATATNTWFSAVTYSPYSLAGGATLFLGTATGRCYKVVNAHQNNPTVTEITGNDFPEANIACVAVGGSEDTLMVVFSNYGVSSLWQTYDGGDTWAEKEGNLPDMPIRWALYHPNSSKYCMLATETGIWTTDHLDQQNVTWTPDNEGLANVRVDMLQLRKADNTVLAATHGRGLATTVWDIATGVENEQELKDFSIYPNPTTGMVYMNLPSIEHPVDFTVFDILGQRILTLRQDARPNISMDLRGFPEGVYMIRVKTGNNTMVRKVIVGAEIRE